MNFLHLRLFFIWVTSALAALSLPGCQLIPVESTPGPTANITQAYQTVEARLTMVHISTEERTSTPAPTDTRPAATPSPISTNPVPLPTRTPDLAEQEACDRAAPGFPKIDVEIDDDTIMQPGQRFTKVWRLANSGTCTWTREYQAVWFFGTKLGDVEAQRLPAEVPPKESVDIVVDMIAPLTPGTYQSNWKLQNAEGTTFGIGPTGNSPFWVRIVVVQPPTSTPPPTASPQPQPTATPEPTDTPAPSPTPAAAASGQVGLDLEDGLNLNNGNVSQEEGADLVYQSDGFNNWLLPKGGTALGVFGSSEPARENCLNAAMSAAPIAVGSLNPGTYLCYTTSLGLPGWLRLNSIEEDTFTISLSFNTWAGGE